MTASDKNNPPTCSWVSDCCDARAVLKDRDKKVREFFCSECLEDCNATQTLKGSIYTANTEPLKCALNHRLVFFAGILVGVLMAGVLTIISLLL